MRVLLCLALVFCAGVFCAGAASAQSPVWLRDDAVALTGAWGGVYDCSQGPTAVALDLRGDADGGLKATFRFSPVASNPTVPSGAYRMVGALYADGRVALIGERWDARPADYVMVDFEGWSDFSEDVLRGSICGNAVVLARRPQR